MAHWARWDRMPVTNGAKRLNCYYYVTKWRRLQLPEFLEGKLCIMAPGMEEQKRHNSSGQAESKQNDEHQMPVRIQSRGCPQTLLW